MPMDTQAKASDTAALVNDLTTNRILCYLQGTLDHDLLLRRTSMSEIVVYTDADLAVCLDTCRSTLGYAVFLDDNLVSCSSKRQNVISCSSPKEPPIHQHFHQGAAFLGVLEALVQSEYLLWS
jgi:hypothetical protein